jgi:hypothetical protein
VLVQSLRPLKRAEAGWHKGSLKGLAFDWLWALAEYGVRQQWTDESRIGWPARQQWMRMAREPERDRPSRRPFSPQTMVVDCLESPLLHRRRRTSTLHDPTPRMHGGETTEKSPVKWGGSFCKQQSCCKRGFKGRHPSIRSVSTRRAWVPAALPPMDESR